MDLKSSKNKINAVTNNFYFMKLIWKISPKRVIFSFLSSLLDFGLWVFFSVTFMNYLFGAAEFKRGFTEVAFFLAGVLLFMLIFSVFDTWFVNRFTQMNDQKLHYHLNMLLFEKATSVDISCYENPEFYDSYTKASSEVYTRAASVLKNLPMVFSALLSSTYVIYVIFCINKLTALCTILPFIGNFLFGKMWNKIQYNRNNENIPYQRRQDYVNRTVYLQKFAKEIRLSGVFKVLKEIYDTAYKGLISVAQKYAKKAFFAGILKSVIAFPLFFEGVWLYSAYNAMVLKTISIGDFIVLASAIVSTTWMLINLSDSIVTSYQNGIYIQNLREFMGYENKIVDEAQRVPVKGAETLEFRNVTFAYDGQTEPVLKNINLIFTKGKKAALVGHNGAGKTTLIKLIMRLYDPSEGEILLNGINIKKYDINEYRRLIGTTFQDFQIFSMTVLENVIMNSIIDVEIRKKAVQALKQCEMFEKVSSLPKQEDTLLTREFDETGAILSGGQYQKIAIARAFAKNCGILLLDEPSSALDPVAEYQMYESIMRLCSPSQNGDAKISVIISHRLSSAAMADEIVVMENGSVIEEGSHQCLMGKKGVYADMFLKQAKNYLQEVYLDDVG